MDNSFDHKNAINAQSLRSEFLEGTVGDWKGKLGTSPRGGQSTVNMEKIGTLTGQCGGAAGRRVDTILPGGAQFNRGLKLHTDDPWDGMCWGEEEVHRKSNPRAEGREAACGIFGGDWERQRETPCIECGLLINSLLAEAGLLVLQCGGAASAHPASSISTIYSTSNKCEVSSQTRLFLQALLQCARNHSHTYFSPFPTAVPSCNILPKALSFLQGLSEPCPLPISPAAPWNSHLILKGEASVLT